MKRSVITIFLFLLMADAAVCQFNIIFLAEVYGRSVDGIGNFQVQNLTGQPQSGRMIITIRENISRTQLVTINTPLVTFSPGSSNFPRTSFMNSSFNFSSSSLARITSQTRSLPPGEYTFCFRFISTDTHAEEFENCFDATIQPLVPLSLLNPGDRDKICQKRPMLSWQPPLPFPPSMRFRLLLTEKKQGEAVENLLMNAPLILLDNIPSTTINYPSFSPDLEEGKTYCWQVIAYQDGVIVSRSEIWEFTVQCTEPSQPAVNDSYRELKLLMNGNYYIANGMLRFSFQNNYNLKKLDYALYEAGNGSGKIKNIPAVSIRPGLNKIDIDLTDLDLKAGKHYILKVYPFNEQPVEVRFIYQENDNGNLR